MRPEASQQKNSASPACAALIATGLCCDSGNGGRRSHEA